MSSFKFFAMLALIIAASIGASACDNNDSNCESTGAAVAGWVIFLIILGGLICCCLAICGTHSGYHYQRYNTLPPYWGPYGGNGAVIQTGPAYAAPAVVV